MASKARHYFASGNTAQGYIDYFSSNLQGLEKVFILKGGPGTGKSYLIKSIAGLCENNGFDYECIHCPSDPASLDGLIIPKLLFAVVDGTAPHIIEPSVPGAIEEYVNLGSAWDSDKLKEHKNEIIHISNRISECCNNAYKCFADGMAVHDEWEKIYIKNMDFAKADTLISETVKNLIHEKSTDKVSIVKHRFFGASTPEGPVNYIENLTSGLKKRYLLKGRPGTGKSTLLKKITSASANFGFDVEAYHCSFDSNSLDMVLLPELDLCVFDSTAPHSFEPTMPGDEIIDMYSKCIKPGTDEKYKREIQGISARYMISVRCGTQYLSEAKKLHDELKNIYTDATNFEKIDLMRNDVAKAIESLAG